MKGYQKISIINYKDIYHLSLLKHNGTLEVQVFDDYRDLIVVLENILKLYETTNNNTTPRSSTGNQLSFDF